MENIVVSIVVPVYNAEKYLSQTIDSLLKQTYPYLDIIIIDDGSVDSSPKICDGFADPRIRVFHRKNVGLSASRQFGIDMAYGEYICTVDSDDYYSELFVELMIKAIRESQADICICNRYNFSDYEKEFVEINMGSKSIDKQITKMDISERLLEIGQNYILSDSWNKLYRTAFIRNSGVRFELPKEYNGNDLVFNYKLIFHCPQICILRKNLLYHRIIENSMVHKRNKKIQEGFEVIITQIYNESLKCGVNANIQIGSLYYVLLSVVVMNIVFYSNEKPKELKEYLRRHSLYAAENTFIKEAVVNNQNRDIMKKLINLFTFKSDFIMLLITCEIYSFLYNIKHKISKFVAKFC